jgi:hypothetical protein
VNRHLQYRIKGVHAWLSCSTYLRSKCDAISTGMARVRSYDAPQNGDATDHDATEGTRVPKAQ